MKNRKEKTAKKGEKPKPKKEVYVEKKGLIGVGDDYHIYHMQKKDRLLAFLAGLGAGALIVYVFFKSIVFSIIAGVLAGILVQPLYCGHLCEKRKKTLLMQFRDMLESLASSYSAGKNTQGAFEDAYGDMVQIYGKESDIAKELGIILAGINSNINVEKMLMDFADRSEQRDIESFADVFEVSVKQGANIKDIISATRDIINDKIEIELEIGTMLAGNKNELNIMMVMPLIIMLSMEGLGGSMTSNSPLNIVIKLIAIGIFGAAYMIGRKLTDIKV